MVYGLVYSFIQNTKILRINEFIIDKISAYPRFQITVTIVMSMDYNSKIRIS